MKKCKPLKEPPHGKKACSTEDDSFGTVCVFTCDPGFQLVGSPSRTCLAIEVYDGLSARCRGEA